jgi:hypothetical protein
MTSFIWRTKSDEETSEHEDFEEIIDLDDIEMPIIDENDPDLAVFEDL